MDGRSHPAIGNVRALNLANFVFLRSDDSMSGAPDWS